MADDHVFFWKAIVAEPCYWDSKASVIKNHLSGQGIGFRPGPTSVSCQGQDMGMATASAMARVPRLHQKHALTVTSNETWSRFLCTSASRCSAAVLAALRHQLSCGRWSRYEWLMQSVTGLWKTGFYRRRPC